MKKLKLKNEEKSGANRFADHFPAKTSDWDTAVESFNAHVFFSEAIIAFNLSHFKAPFFVGRNPYKITKNQQKWPLK